MNCPICGYRLTWHYVHDPSHYNRRCVDPDQTGYRRLYFCPSCEDFLLAHEGYFEYCDDDSLIVQYISAKDLDIPEDTPHDFPPIWKPTIYNCQELQEMPPHRLELAMGRVLSGKAEVRVHLHGMVEDRLAEEAKERRELQAKQDQRGVLYLPFTWSQEDGNKSEEADDPLQPEEHETASV